MGRPWRVARHGDLTNHGSVNALLTTLFQRLQDAQFSAPQAAAYWDEVHALASPMLFSFSALRQEPRLRAVAAAHAILRDRVLHIQTPAQWEEYCQQMPVLMHLTQQAVCERWEGCEHVLRDYWPVLAMDEGVADYARRTTMGHGISSERDIEGWPDLLAQVHRRYALDVLCGQVQLPSHAPIRSWQRVLRMTGLRSVRWSYGDEPGTPRHQQMLMQALLHAQDLLRGGIRWPGPILGLAGSTSLALTDRGASDGMVQPDPGGMGQTMTLGHWSVLAHEWMHALDIRLARHFNCTKTWATHAGLEWDGAQDPPEPLMVWFWQLGTILGAAPPEKSLPAIRQEMIQWEQRVLDTLGHGLHVQEEITRQRVQIHQKKWSASDAEEGWLRVLHGEDIAQQHRTAHLLARDAAFALDVGEGKCEGYWSEYVARMRTSLQEMGTSTNEIGVLNEHSCAGQTITSLRYLTSAVEVMARSFECSLAGEHPDNIWIPSSYRPNGGLLWPAPIEAALMGEAWRQTLRNLRPVWQEWRAESSAAA